MTAYFIPIRDFIELLPGDWAGSSNGSPTSPLDEYGIKNYSIRKVTGGLYVEVDFGLNPYAPEEAALVLALPPFPDLGIVFRNLGRSQIWFVEDFQFRVSLGAFSIRLPPQILRPVVKDASGAWIDDPNRSFAEIDFKFTSVDLVSGQVISETAYPLVLTIDRNATFDFDYPLEIEGGQQLLPEISLNGPVMLGKSGVVITAEGVRFNFNFEDPIVSFDEAKVMLPSGLTGGLVLPDIIFREATISRRGFSGSVTADWPLQYQEGRFVYLLDGDTQDANIFGLNGGLNQITLEFENNQITSSSISGGMVVPYFDEPVELTLGIQSSGDFDVTLAGVDEDGITVRKEGLLAANISSIALSRQGNIASVVLTGGMQPLLFESDGLEWPRLDVEELSIEQNITDLSEPPILKFKEAWVDLKKLATLDLFGFHFELNRIGVGYQETDDKLWIDLTGNIKLIEQIPVSIGVEGFRITWPRTLYQDLELETLFQDDPSYTLTAQDAINIASKIEVKFDGVYLSYGVPKAVEFEGLIRFIKEAQKVGFAGDMILRMPATGLEVEAGLMIGINFEEPPYPFLYVYFGILLPSGIPLGQSGLALKGAKGLFGLNVTPAKTDEQNWYYDWYKRGPIEGAHPTNKWEDLRMALAVGAGITITTTDGKLLGVQGLLVLAIPGPFIMIEGKALIFDGIFPGDPPLKALGVFDGRARTVQLNIEAGAELIEDVLEANGVAEAFFDFKDLTNWHLYLGQDEPEDRRVHALILKLAGAYLFKADAYLMTDMVQPYTVRSRLGVFIGFEPPIPPLGPVQVKIDAVITGLGELTIRAGELLGAAASNSLSAESAIDTVNFSGQLNLDANLEITAFGFGLNAAVHAQVMSEGPKPFEVSGKLSVSVEVPLPLEAVESIPVVGSFLDFVEQTFDIPEIEPIEIEIEFVFRPNDFTVPKLVSPLRPTMSMESHFIQKSEEVMIRKGIANYDPAVDVAKRSPTVEMDHRPVLIFDQEMNVTNDTSLMASPIAAHPAGVKKINQGMVTFEPTLKRIMLYEHNKSQPWDEDAASSNSNEPDGNWTKIADTAIAQVNTAQGAEPLFGIWRADADVENPEQAPRRTLRLWSMMPFGPAIGPAYYIAIFGHQNQIEAATKAHEDFFVGVASKAQKTCIDFKEIIHLRFRQPDAQKPKYDRLPVANPLTVEGITLIGELGLFIPTKKGKPCLTSPGNFQIKFNQLVRWVEITFCEKTPDIIIAEAPILVREESKDEDNPARVEVKHHSVQTKRQSSDPRTVVITSEQAFDQITIMRKASCVCRVCYKTHEDMLNEEVDGYQLEVNDELFTPAYFGSQPVLKPGRHYRIVVQSEVVVAPNLASNPFSVESFLHDPAATLASNIVNEILGATSGTKSFTDEAYFQTDGPPTNLQRLIKWTTPQLNEKRFFRDNDFLIRFKRSYIRELFSENAFQLDAYVRASNGITHDNWDIHWSKPQSSTLTPDEQAWLDHLQSEPQYDSLIESVPKDDVLRISVSQIADLSPATGVGWIYVDLNPKINGNWQIVDDPRFGASMQVMRQSHQTRTIAVAKQSSCREFHFSTTLFSGKPNEMGVVFRYVDSKNYYLFTLDRQSSKQKLVKVVNGEPQELLVKNFGFEPNQLQRLSVTAKHESPSTSHFEIRLNGHLWGEYSDNDGAFADGAIGLYVAGNNDANFVNPRLTLHRPLNPQSRYELIIAGGNAGELVFGDSYAESLLQQSFGTTGWSLGSGSAWQIHTGGRKITKMTNQLGNLLLLNSSLTSDVDIRAHITGLTDGGQVGFVIRAPLADQLNSSQESRHYRVVISRQNGKLDLCVCLWSSLSGELEKICDELVASASYPEDGFDFRVNVFGTRVKIFLFHQLKKELSLTEFSVENPLLLEGQPGILATTGVSFQQLQIRRSELGKIPFMTSEFPSYGEMIASGRNRVTDLVVQSAVTAISQSLDAVKTLMDLFTYQRFRLETSVVDFRDGSMDHEAFEAARQGHRTAKAVLDESFADLCNSLTGIFYNPLADHVDSYLLNTDSGVGGVYIRSPEPLDIKANVDPSLLNDDDGTSDLNAWQQIGSTDVQLHKDGELFDHPTYILFNGDGNHLLLLLNPFDPSSSHFEPGSYTLRFVHARNLHDDTSDIDHRYDRPIKSCLGFDAPEVAELHWTIN